MEQYADANGEFFAYKDYSPDVKYAFIAQNIDYLANQAIPYKNFRVLTNLMGTLLPMLKTHDEFKAL